MPTDSPRRSLACLLHLGAVAGEAGKADVELRYTRDAVTHSDRMRHSFHRVASRNNLANALVETGQAELAVPVATRALGLADDGRLSGIIGAILHTRGTAHLRLGDLEAAEADALTAAPLVEGSQFESEVRDLLAEIRGKR